MRSFVDINFIVSYFTQGKTLELIQFDQNEAAFR